MNAQLRDSSMPMKIGFLLALLTIIYGFSIGVMFGEFEDNVKEGLRADAEVVLDSTYNGDMALVNRSVSGSITYFLRAHIHANGLGMGTAVLITILLIFFPASNIRDYSSLLLGLGALGYSSYWMITGIMGPDLGGVQQAKALTGWYAIFTSGLYFAGLAALFYLFVRVSFLKK